MVNEDIDNLPADLGTLRLVEEACSGRGDTWSDTVSMRVQDTALATQDRRNIAEWIQDTEMANIKDEDEPRMRKDESGVMNRNSSLASKSQARATTSTNRGRIARILPTNPEFEENLIRNGIIPEGHKLLCGGLSAEPNNLDEIIYTMRRKQPSLLVSLLSLEAYGHFKELNQLASARDIEASIILLLTRDMNPNCYSTSTEFSSLDPLTDEPLVKATPDLYYGAHSKSLNRDILNELSGLIQPSKKRRCPIAPNCFLEVSNSKDYVDTLKRQTCYNRALGARGILSLQTYGSREPSLDGNAYTFTSTLLDGILKIFATYPFRSRGTAHLVEYHITLLGAWPMAASLKKFQQGIVAFRNVVGWASTTRDEFIEIANRRRMSMNVPEHLG